MPFNPQVDEVLVIEETAYRIAEHPAALGLPYGQEGRQAVVYQVEAGDGTRRALKVLKPRYRLPSLVSLADRLASLPELPGLLIRDREVLSPDSHGEVLDKHPDLRYAILMPWVAGPTWMEVMVQKQILDVEQSLTLAHGLVHILAKMEGLSMAHCDLSGANVLLPALNGGKGIQLVDIEQIYTPDLQRPELLPGGSPGYDHENASDGQWDRAADRFSGAVLLAEMLGWSDERVRRSAWGESYFAPKEMQRDSERYQLLVTVLRERVGSGFAKLFQRAWRSDTLADCPALAEWLVAFEEWSSQEEEENAMNQEEARRRLAQAIAEKAEALMAMGRLEQALQEFEDAHRLAPDLVAGDYAQALVKQAAVGEDAGELDQALLLYRRALQIAPEGGSLREEVRTIVSSLEQELQEEVHARPAEDNSLIAYIDLPANEFILWLSIMLVGWGAALGFNRFTLGHGWLALIFWIGAGALAGALQWAAVRSIGSVKLWWIPAAAAGWASCWALGWVVAGWWLHPFWIVESGADDLSVALVRNIQWGDSWHVALLLNAVFNGASALLLLRQQVRRSRPFPTE